MVGDIDINEPGILTIKRFCSFCEVLERGKQLPVSGADQFQMWLLRDDLMLQVRVANGWVRTVELSLVTDAGHASRMLCPASVSFQWNVP